MIFKLHLSLKTCHLAPKLAFRMLSSSSSTTSDEVLSSKLNHIGQIILNRPKQLNALNLNMVKAMQGILTDFDQDKNIKAVVIKGAGDTAFCAGGDVKTIRELVLKGERKYAARFFKEEYIVNNLIANFKKPYIALINGITMGGGVGVSVHGRYRIATEKTMFAMPETAIGFFADVGGTYFLPRLKDNLGLYLVLTGNRLKGAEVKVTGIATHYMNSAKLPDLEKKLYESNDLSDKSIDEIIKSFDENVSCEIDTSKISKIFNESRLEDIISNLEKDNTEWSKKQLKLLEKMSPISLKVAIKQLQWGLTRNLKECLEMEYLLAQKFAIRGDFLEGVRAVLVDRGSKPNWNPPTYKDVSDSLVDWYFDFNVKEDDLDRSKL